MASRYPHPQSTAPFRYASEAEAEASATLHAGVAASRVGSVLGERFELVRLVGAGSYGDVYEARDGHNPGSPLALKLLRRPEANALYRFKREFRGLAEVSHPNLVALHELCVIDELNAFFTMELVRGSDLLSYVRSEGVLDEQRLRSALRQLTAGVSALHALGRLHRDLKPANVLVDETGRVVIVDFGLATALGEQGAGVELGFAGTPLYAAPEQFVIGGSVGPESDWYAVGTMLYEALSGRMPYAAAAFARLAYAKLERPKPLSLPATLTALGELSLRLLEPVPRVRAAEPELRVVLGEPAISSPSAPASVLAARELAFVGRQAELARLAEAFACVEQGGRACAVVLAPSGLGKTALIERFLTELQASRRALVLRGRCYVNEDMPYRAADGLVDALSNHLLQLPVAEAEALVPCDARALAQIFPVLMRVAPIASAQPARSAGAEYEITARERGVRVLRELLVRLSDRLPLVLFIDDLQWDDADSAWLISALMADPDPPSLLLVVACRRDEKQRSHVLRALERDAAVVRVTREVELAGLAREETIALALGAIAGAAPSPAVLAEIAEESAGHPMFALELARWARSAGVPGSRSSALSLEAAIQNRAANLPPSARRLLELTCVAGHRLKLHTALRTCGEEAPALRELVARKLVSATGTRSEDSLEAYHDRVREALLEALPPEQVCALRRALAEALADEAAPRFDLIVEHYLAAGLPADAARYALPAADHAAGVLAFHRVPPLIELAIAHAQPEARSCLYVRLGQACSLVSRTRDAARAFQQAAELEPDPEQRWELRRMAMWQALQGDDFELGLSLLRELDRPFGLHGVRLTWWRLLLNFVWLSIWHAFGPPELRAEIDRSPSRARDQKRLRLVWSATTGLASSHPARAGYFMVTAFRLAARLGDASVYAPMLAGYTSIPAMRAGRRRHEAEAGIARAAELARARGDADAVQIVALTQADYLLYTAQPKRAERLISSLLEAPFSTTEAGTQVKAAARSVASPIFFWSGELKRTRAHAGAWIREAREHADPHLEHGLAAIAAHRFLCNDDVEQALSEWLRVCEQHPGHSAHNDALWGTIIGLYAGRIDVAERALALSRRLFWRVNAYVAQGRAIYFWTRGAVAAARIAGSDSSLRTRWGLSSAIWALRFERAQLAAPMREHLLAARAFARGRHAEGVAHLERTQASYTALGYRLFAACASHALSALHPDERVRDAHAARAREVFDAEGLECPERWVRALLAGLPVGIL